MLKRLVGCILAAGLLAGWLHGSAVAPAAASIPVTSLSTGNNPTNNWTGITSPATTIFTGGDGRKYIRQNPDSGAIVATGATWRDQEVTTYMRNGTIQLRSVANGGLFFSYGIAASNSVRIGIISAGVQYNTMSEDNASGCITNWPPDGGHTFTFGVRGFDVYLKIDGVQAIDTCKTTAINPTGAIAYKEYRSSAMGVGAPTVQPVAGVGARDITFTYFPLTALGSAYASNQFDPRDFGMRSVGAVTGSMSAASATLNLNSARDFRVGDQVIVEVGGESPSGYNTVGVGGASPVLHYADAATRNADHSQPAGTYSYLDTDGTVTAYNAGTTVWDAVDLGGTYYIGKKTALSLVAKVTAVNASPATQLTLNASSAVATTNANVYLDSLPSFYPYTTSPAISFAAGGNDGLPSYSNMTLTIPAGIWYFSNSAVASNAASAGNERTGFTLTGQGTGSTTVQNPKGVPSQFLDTGINSTITVQGFTYVGNLGDAGYGFAIFGANKQFAGDYPIGMTGGTSSSNLVFQNLACTNDFRGCVSISGVNPQILNSTTTVNVGQRAYVQWQFQLVDCMSGQIANSTATGTYLLKAFEMFACNGASINNVTGTNALFSTNSSTSWTIDTPNVTFTANSFFDQNSGWIDEAIINVNNNAFGSGNTGLINNPRLIQQGYIDPSNNTLKFIQIATNQTDVTVQGQFPGGGGCSTTLGGFFQAPNHDAGSVEFGPIIYSDAARTIVNGIRIKGTAIGTPGHSGHFGNVSLVGASSQVNNSVADVIQTGPTLSGNQTNAAYGGC